MKKYKCLYCGRILIGQIPHNCKGGNFRKHHLKFKEMGNAAMALSKKADILGPDIIQKHVGFIKRQMMKISEFMKKIIVKIVVTACILVG